HHQLLSIIRNSLILSSSSYLNNMEEIEKKSTSIISCNGFEKDEKDEKDAGSIPNEIQELVDKTFYPMKGSIPKQGAIKANAVKDLMEGVRSSCLKPQKHQTAIE